MSNFLFMKMGRRGKRKAQLLAARQSKKKKNDSELDYSMILSNDLEYSSEEDDDYNPDNDDISEVTLIDCFSQEWVESLSRDDTMALSILLHKLLACRFHIGVTESAKIIGELLCFSDRTIREWRSVFFANNGSFPDTQQGRYQRSGVLWKNEELNEAVRKFVRENGCVKGKKTSHVLPSVSG
jgi:hypothetical protein